MTGILDPNLLNGGARSVLALVGVEFAGWSDAVVRIIPDPPRVSNQRSISLEHLTVRLHKNSNHILRRRICAERASCSESLSFAKKW